ncbi:STM4014 family protein [Paenibacillus sp. ACRRY]|uniref:STM4014 family protein n=1 Tax=Paenibacillus sp. ACRRY TaxID=2918208 RepID=UPI001EF68A14|nr:STM4014 family protein [Paenibacillus sp. ACRRY]MCG7386488.1 STM4014 family protein [Paenibacillus sp. ACRRY]
MSGVKTNQTADHRLQSHSSEWNKERPFWLIGNPDNRRTTGLQQARLRCGLSPAEVLPYADLLKTWRQGGSLADLVNPSLKRKVTAEVAPLIRIDAPGEQWDVERELLSLGAKDGNPNTESLSRESFTAEEALELRQDWGRIYAPAQWFNGWKGCLKRIGREAGEGWPSARFLNDPEDIATMFDKRKCQQHLSGHGVYVPPVLQSAERILSYSDLRAAMQASGMYRVFVKLAYGSAASGVVAYQINPRTGAEIAVTTVGMTVVKGRPIFYNEGRMQRYTAREEIEILLDWLCAEGAQVERWMAKASYGSRVFDIRQLVAGGHAGHAIVRLSQTPITNLHLRNERMLPEEAGVDDYRLDLVHTAAQTAMAAFPNSWSAGIDVMLTVGANPRAYVLDVNPFGDLLYHVQHNGLGTYEWEMDILRKNPYEHA